jgi:hypothetical protein
MDAYSLKLLDECNKDSDLTNNLFFENKII